MARRGIPTGPVIWYLREWMAAAGITKQVDMMERTGWSKAKMSQLYNEQQDFNSDILTEAATAVNARPFELLMHPEDAFAYRRFQDDAIRIAADRRVTYTPAPADVLDGRRKAG